MTKIISESLQYLDMEHQVYPILGIDQYKSKIGDDSEFVTVDFTVKSKSVSEDLVTWLERGYDWIIDSEESPGEVKNNQYLVFAEMNRRTWVPKRVIEMLADFETLTGIKAGEWRLRIGDELYPATEQNIRDNVTLSPHEYRIEREGELNEWREMAGLDTVPVYQTEDDPNILEMQRQAGII